MSTGIHGRTRSITATPSSLVRHFHMDVHGAHQGLARHLCVMVVDRGVARTRRQGLRSLRAHGEHRARYSKWRHAQGRTRAGDAKARFGELGADRTDVGMRSARDLDLGQEELRA